MRHVRLIFFALLFVLARPGQAIDAESPGAGWKEANRKKDIVIFTRDNPKAGAREIHAVSEVDAAPEVVFRVVGDFENYAKFMPYVKESKILETKGPTLLYVYALLSPPLVSDRDYAIEVKRTAGSDANGGVYTSAWTSKSEMQPERDGVVRVKLNTGSWTIEPLDGGARSRLTYRLLTHPGGSIPDWIANKSNTIAIPDLMKAVKGRAAEFKKK